MKNHVLVILGPTASGKTELACRVAVQLDAEIISADSRQIYKFMDIGTGKDLEEYTLDGIQIPYHLIDIKDPGYRYNIAEYHEDFLRVSKEIFERNKQVILCGGSGLYLETAIEGHSFLGIPKSSEIVEKYKHLSKQEIENDYHEITPKLKQKLPGQTVDRMIRAIEIDSFLKANPEWEGNESAEYSFTVVGTLIDREERRNKITKRLKQRLENGLIEEVEFLLKNYLTYEDLEYYGLEYKWVGNFLNGSITKAELFDGLNIAIHQFAKRQMTWFRRMEKRGIQIRWIDVDLPMEERVNQVLSFYHIKQ